MLERAVNLGHPPSSSPENMHTRTQAHTTHTPRLAGNKKVEVIMQILEQSDRAQKESGFRPPLSYGEAKER